MITTIPASEMNTTIPVASQTVPYITYTSNNVTAFQQYLDELSTLSNIYETIQDVDVQKTISNRIIQLIAKQYV